MKKNLLYHCTPTPNEVWRWNLDQLLPRVHHFDGVKLIAIAQGTLEDGTELLPWSEVRKHIPLDIKCVPTKNDPVLRETASLPELLRRLRDTARGAGITFYAHSKGISRGGAPYKMQEAIRLWTQVMYEMCLDRVPEIEKILETKACCGAFKRYGRFGHFPRTSHWHYSGTFFWFRNDKLFQKEWENVPRSRYGAEAYLSTLFDESEAGCIFGDGVTDLYNVGYLRRILAAKNGTPPKMNGRTVAPGIVKRAPTSSVKKGIDPKNLSDVALPNKDGRLVITRRG